MSGAANVQQMLTPLGIEVYICQEGHPVFKYESINRVSEKKIDLSSNSHLNVYLTDFISNIVGVINSKYDILIIKEI